ncbi:MAG: rhodanese-like domain-containing protein [Brumimicrobium sp.]
MQELNQEKWRKAVKTSSNAVILDVRKPEECAEGIIPNAIEIDILNPDYFMSEIEKLDKDKSYYIYCRSGARSAQACMVMDQMGFKDTYNLLGGIMEWKGEIQNN